MTATVAEGGSIGNPPSVGSLEASWGPSSLTSNGGAVIGQRCLTLDPQPQAQGRNSTGANSRCTSLTPPLFPDGSPTSQDSGS